MLTGLVSDVGRGTERDGEDAIEDGKVGPNMVGRLRRGPVSSGLSAVGMKPEEEALAAPEPETRLGKAA